jgi:hypothetical protein
MLKPTTDARIQELTQLIATERDAEKFTNLVAELNNLLNGLQEPRPSEKQSS